MATSASSVTCCTWVPKWKVTSLRLCSGSCSVCGLQRPSGVVLTQLLCGAVRSAEVAKPPPPGGAAKTSGFPKWPIIMWFFRAVIPKLEYLCFTRSKKCAKGRKVTVRLALLCFTPLYFREYGCICGEKKICKTSGSTGRCPIWVI